MKIPQEKLTNTINDDKTPIAIASPAFLTAKIVAVNNSAKEIGQKMISVIKQSNGERQIEL